MNKNKIEIDNISNFSLSDTLDCGQCFRWDEQDDGSFVGAVKDKCIKISQQRDKIIIEGSTEKEFEEIWKRYFDLETDYNMICEELVRAVPKLKESAKYASGIRILYQEPWETLCSFIISQNNNIPRIKGIISRLCSNFGREILPNIYEFPSADVLSKITMDDLAPLRSGFRAGYILDAARKVSSGEIDLEKIREMPMNMARKELIKIHGVGPKVAECTLLYGLHRLEAFPMDVWMKRAMSTFFSGLSPENFGKYAGVAQQYIFHYSRMHPDLFE